MATDLTDEKILWAARFTRLDLGQSAPGPSEAAPGAGASLSDAAPKEAGASLDVRSDALGGDGVMVAALGVGEALSALAILQTAVMSGGGGFSVTTAVVSYPKEAPMVTPAAKEKTSVVARFVSDGLMTMGHLQADVMILGDFDDAGFNGNPAMFNVQLVAGNSTDFSRSSLKFTAAARPTMTGTVEWPTIQFDCHAEFDPNGPAWCVVEFVLEVTRNGLIKVDKARVSQGNATIGPNGYGILITAGWHLGATPQTSA